MIDPVLVAAALALAVIVMSLGTVGCFVDRSGIAVPSTDIEFVVRFHPPSVYSAIPGLSPPPAYQVRIEVFSRGVFVNAVTKEGVPDDTLPDGRVEYRLSWRFIPDNDFVYPGTDTWVGELGFGFRTAVYGVHDPEPRVAALPDRYMYDCETSRPGRFRVIMDGPVGDTILTTCTTEEVP